MTVFLLFPSSYASAVTFSDFELSTVVQVVSYQEHDDEYYSGTGFFTDFTSGCIITAAHVLLDEFDEDVRDVTLIILNAGTDAEEIYYGIPIVVDPNLDTAYVCISDETFVQKFRHYFELEAGAVNFLDVGDNMTAIGYPSFGGETLTSVFGQLTGFITFVEARDILKTDLDVTEGISGGPLITDAKKIAGIIYAKGEDESGGTLTLALSTDIVLAAIGSGVQALIDDLIESGDWVIPDNCFAASAEGAYLLNGQEYYDSRCQIPVDPSLEELLTSQYEYWCDVLPEEGYITDASWVLNDQEIELSINDWREYLNTLCGELEPNDPYNFFTPDQTLTTSLVKSDESSAVYAILKDGKRHAFPNESVYKSWFGEDFSLVRMISADELSDYSLGSNITYHPGYLIKIPSIPKVYLVSDDNELRWLMNEDTAKTLYGDGWATLVHDVPESLFTNYGSGEDMSL